MPHESLISKLIRANTLNSADLMLLKSVSIRAIFVKKGATVQRDHDVRPNLFVIQKGWMVRSRILRDGTHRVISFMIPGDLSEPGLRSRGRSDHTISAVTDAVIGCIAPEDLIGVATRSPTIADALGAALAQDLILMRNRIVSIGGQDGLGRLLHLLVELRERLRLAGLGTGDHMDLPMNREWLASALALSPRHLSRVIAEGRREGLIDVTGSSVTFLNGAEIMDRVGDDLRHLGLSPDPVGPSPAFGVWSRPASKA